MTAGHFSIDYVRLPERPLAKPTLGGPPTFVSLAAANLGANVSVISKVGEDFPPRFVRWLESRSINLSALRRVEGALTTSFVLDYRGDGDRQLALKNRGPPIEPIDVPDSFEAKAVHVGPIANEIPHETVLRLRGLTELLSLDPQGFLRRFREDGRMYLDGMENAEGLGEIDVFKASEEEIGAVTGRSDLAEAIRSVNERGVETVIVTRGVKGSLLYDGGKLYVVPASKPRVVVDATGSGDVFIGAFLAEYIRGKEALWCASVGSASASFVVEELGPRGFGSKREVYERATAVYEKTSVATAT